MTPDALAPRAGLALLAALAASPATAQAPAAPPPEFDRFVEQVMTRFGIPGLTVAIVKDGHVVLARGYGVRRMGEPDRVDADTRFGIASNSKAFTALALGLLVEDGLVEWDAPVVRYLPWFQMHDPWVTRALTVRDLLVHRSGLGLGAGDLLWWPESTLDRREIARRLRFIPPATSFRSAYAYDNVLYTVAGEVIEAVSGQTWESFVTERLLQPVGMTGATVLHSDAGTGGNVAGTHALVDGRLQAVRPMLSDNTNPAGGINAGAADMARWLIAQLDSGRVGERRIWRPATTVDQWDLVTPIRPGTPAVGLEPLRANFNGYGLGFFVRDYRGHKMLTHTGGLPGYVSRVAMIPDLRLGVAVLQNTEAVGHDVITWQALDHFLGASHDWLGAYGRLVARRDSIMGARRAGAAAQRATSVGPSLPLDRYAGTYEDAWYGTVSVDHADGGLVMRFAHTPSLVGDLVHWQYDTFLVRWRQRDLRADAFATFVLDETGAVVRVPMKPASPEVDFSFDFQDLDLRPRPASGPR